MKSSRTARRNGFTLTELLVAMGVIAILAALFNPVLQRALQSAQSAKCISHLQQINTALQTFASDNSQQLPVMLPLRSSTTDPGPTLDTALSSYLTDPNVFHCPSDPTVYGQSGCSYLWVYGYSVNAQGQQNSNMVSPSFPLLNETDLSKIPFVSDKQGFHKILPNTHILYGDGHVE
jgi:prepilin-type N-terminal cleavage/methylation domain-containing protein/prepilin-type processing-associated H-X9-DG protein